MNARRAGTLMVVALVSALSSRGEGPPTTGPAEVFHRVMPANLFRQRLDDAIDDLGNLEALAASPLAAAGQRVITIEDGGSAKAAGMQLGDVIVEVDGEPLLHCEFNDMRKDQDQTLTIVTAGPSRRTVRVPPGRIKVNLEPVVRPELIYLRGKHRDARWDRYAVVGAATYRTSPALAETAWAHAIEAGYPRDGLSDYCGAQAIWRQGRPQEAAALVDALVRRGDVPAELDVKPLVHALALANFRVEQAIETAPPAGRGGDHEPLTRHLRALLAAVRQAPDDYPPSPSPSELVASRGVTSLLSAMEPKMENGPRDGFRKTCSDTLAGGRVLDLSAPSDHYNVIVQMPTEDAADVEVIVRGTIHLADQETARYGKVFLAGLVDCDNPNRVGLGAMSSTILAVNVFDCRTAVVSQASREEVENISVAEETDQRREFALRLIHAGNRDEVWINQRRLIYLPSTERPKRVGLRLGTVGVSANVQVAYSRINAGK